MSIDTSELRCCLGQFATEVTVVSCRVGDTVHGATVNAFMAVSLQPPLIAVSLDRRSKACRFLDRRSFAVYILSRSSHELALHFAGQPKPGVCVEWVPNRIAPTISGRAQVTGLPWQVTLDSPAAGTVWHTHPHRMKEKTP
jgi:flavin reductase (DIM6/NTAB) family NADH-FMN oxidoreductase RutF